MGIVISMSTVILIAAVSANNVIGSGGTIPWHHTPTDYHRYKADLKRFAAFTSGNAVIVGGNTWRYDLDYGRKLKNLEDRHWIVISNDPHLADEYFNRTGKINVWFYSNIEKAVAKLKDAHPEKKIFIAGGAQIYKAALSLDLVDACDITWIEKEFEGDTYFPTNLMLSSFAFESEVIPEEGGMRFTLYLRKPQT